MLVDLGKLRDEMLGDHPSAVLAFEAAFEADAENEEAAMPLVDDPVPRQSHHSYFTQMADLVAYAGYRRAFPPRRSCVCTDATWLGMGKGIRWETDGTLGDGDGVVVG